MADPGTPEWFAQVHEEIVEPDLEIIDAHHHLWPESGVVEYWIDDLAADMTSGHNVVGSVFIECMASYRDDGPDHLKPLGETEFVAAAAVQMNAEHPAAPPIVGIVAHADLTHPALDDVLDGHEELGGGRFCGIRDALSLCDDPALLISVPHAEGKFEDPAFLAGVRRLGNRGLTYESWHYHWQNAELASVARSCPETTIVLDHFGTPLGVGAYEGRRKEIFEEWKRGILDAAACQNVVAKLGGLAMPDNGFGWHTAERPPTSDEFIEAQSAYYEFTIDAFGPDRCLFESNFPVDKLSLRFDTVWNAFKKMTSGFSADERTAMFSGTARRVYGL